MRSIALFRAGMLRRLIPPCSFPRYSFLILIVGGAGESSQIKERMILTRAISISRGMLCAFARNWVIPPANICTMCRFASRVGCPFPQRWRAALTLSRTGSQGVTSFVLFPIQAPRILTAFPSSAILISWGRGGSGVYAPGGDDPQSVRFCSGWYDLCLFNVELRSRGHAPFR